MITNGTQPRRILIAEVNHPLVYAPLLSAAGYDIEVVAGGAEALCAIQTGRCHVAVLDEELADPSALNIMRATRGTKIPIVICSQSYNVNRAVEAMKEGAAQYLPRPFHKKDLLHAVATALDGLHVVPPVSEALAERQRQAQKMELFGRLAGGVIHDFNNLLTVVLGCCDMLKMQRGASEHLHEIEHVVHKGAALTGQLLAFARNRPIEPRPLDLNFLLLNMQAMLAKLLGEAIFIDLKLAPDLGLIRADQNQLEQVILNLAVNARDAMPDGGQLTFETREEGRGGRDKDRLDLPRPLDATPLPTNLSPLVPRASSTPVIALCVTDTGCGMDEATQARLFEPFFTTKAEGQGTGLGLATVFRIVAAAQGKIDVASRVGRGTRFTLTFPRLADADARTIDPALEIVPSATSTD